MTTAYVIEITDRLMPNDYTSDEKLRWLRQLEEQIWQEIFLTHEDPDRPEAPDASSCDLLIPDLFAEEVYVPFLQARIAWENQEDAKYNRYSTAFNDGYLRFARWYNERHKPLPKREFWRF